MKSLDIAICTHNRPAELKESLTSLRRMTLPEDLALSLIIVLNACDTETVRQGREDAADLPFEVRVIEEIEPGLSQARNRAIRESQADWLAFLDDDVKVSPGWAVGLAETVTSMTADIVAGRTLLWWRDCEEPAWWSHHFNWIVSAFDHGKHDMVLEPARAIGANFACSRAVYESVGLFDVDLGRKGKSLTAGEESDYLARADVLGFRCVYSACALVRHLVVPERLTEDYFRKIAYHNGRAYYHGKPQRWASLAKSLAYQGFVLIRFSFKQAISRRDTATGRYALVKRSIALGAIQLLIARSMPNFIGRPFSDDSRD